MFDDSPHAEDYQKAERRTRKTGNPARVYPGLYLLFTGDKLYKIQRETVWVELDDPFREVWKVHNLTDDVKDEWEHDNKRQAVYAARAMFVPVDSKELPEDLTRKLTGYYKMEHIWGETIYGTYSLYSYPPNPQGEQWKVTKITRREYAMHQHDIELPENELDDITISQAKAYPGKLVTESDSLSAICIKDTIYTIRLDDETNQYYVYQGEDCIWVDQSLKSSEAYIRFLNSTFFKPDASAIYDASANFFPVNLHRDKAHVTIMAEIPQVPRNIQINASLLTPQEARILAEALIEAAQIVEDLS